MDKCNERQLSLFVNSAYHPSAFNFNVSAGTFIRANSKIPGTGLTSLSEPVRTHESYSFHELQNVNCLAKQTGFYASLSIFDIEAV